VDWLVKVFTSTIGRKLLVGVSGLGLVGFLVMHLAGNLNLYKSADALDVYAESLHALPGFALAEAGLLGMFVLHIVLVIGLVRSNRAARGQAYAVSGSKRSDAGPRSLASRMMAVSGMLLLAFMVVHVAHFRLKRGEFHTAEGVSGLGNTVIETIQQPAWLVLYVVGSLLTGFHLAHGIQSAARSLGLNHRKWTPIVERVGVALAVALSLGFASLPIAAKLGVFEKSATSAAEVAP